MFRLRAGDFVREARTRQEFGLLGAKYRCMRQSYVYAVNSLSVRAEFDERNREEIFLPLLRRLTRLRRKKGQRVVAFLAGPPAAGKSTLCRYLEDLSRSDATLTPVQAAGLDGFHYPQSYLDTHSFNGAPLASIKGAPESYDVAKLARLLARVNEPNQRWPVYNRRVHNPEEGALGINEEILIVEGNWLLLDEAPWNQLDCDYSIFLRAGEESQLERIVARKVAGGFSEAEAREMIRRNDWPNILRCMKHSRLGNLNLIPSGENTWEVISI